MPRRVNLPGAEEFFRPTQGAVPPGGTSGATSGRVRHDEKITIYLSGAELLGLEQARLSLRAQHHAAADRGRIVREAIAIALADLAENGEASELVKRLKG
ncbi:hypothetical protein [uncultured Propionibacterium sp.]|uniref:hypothetical protein n=1 Tax=uncultured Propionibacterium sp. TaxID=218066 RepID=UPI002930752B|nr:hypothetical protein [uncultured Propionibacterium sp.]